MERRLLFALGIAFVCGLTSCTFLRLAFSAKLKNPEFDFRTWQVKTVSEKGVEVELGLIAYNPNDIGLANVTVDYELFHKDKRFLQGGGMRLELPPKDSARLVVPIFIVYDEVFGVIGPAATRLLMNEKSMPVRAEVLLKGNPTLYNRSERGSLWLSSVRVGRTVDVPLTGIRREIGKSIQRALRKMF